MVARSPRSVPPPGAPSSGLQGRRMLPIASSRFSVRTCARCTTSFRPAFLYTAQRHRIRARIPPSLRTYHRPVPFRLCHWIYRRSRLVHLCHSANLSPATRQRLGLRLTRLRCSPRGGCSGCCSNRHSLPCGLKKQGRHYFQDCAISSSPGKFCFRQSSTDRQRVSRNGCTGGRRIGRTPAFQRRSSPRRSVDNRPLAYESRFQT